MALGAALRRPARGDGHERAWHGPQGGDDRLWRWRMELPLLVIDVQRAGPSTGMPTKTEAADLLAALYGRHGESPVPVIAPQTPADCFDAAVEANRIAVRYRTPVILLSDTFLANSSEPWRLPRWPTCPRSTRNSQPSPTPVTSSCHTCATPVAPGPGRSRARRASRTGSAASRRSTAPARSPTTRRTTRS